MKSIFRFIVVFAVLVSGCTSYQDILKNELKPGMSKTEVIDKLGEPYYTDEPNGDVEKWTYLAREGMQYRHIELSFRNGKFLSWRYSGFSPAGSGGYNPLDDATRAIQHNNQQMQMQEMNRQLNQMNYNNMMNSF